jgi:pyruvate-formate lyase-activating enzyme
MEHPRSLPAMVIADGDGSITDFPELAMAGMSNGRFIQPAPEDLIPLPAGSELFALPGRLPVGWDRDGNEPAMLTEHPFSGKEPVQAVAAFMAPAHTTVLTSAYQSQENAPLLPLFAYTAVGWLDGQFWVAAFRSDPDRRQDAAQFNQRQIDRKTRHILKNHKHNRLIQHLGRCCLSYGCPAARNYFLGRWEAPLPTSPQCNARCLGCISEQPSGCCPSTQERITFVPKLNEICEIAVFHLEQAEKAIVSFGQGCEGEPLLQAERIAEAIVKIRSHTSRGTINLNSNSSLPDRVRLLAEAGLDSIRVSLNSAQAEYYHRYYRPKNYHFSDVLRSIDVMKEAGRFVSLNYFILPGFTDSEAELAALSTMIDRHRPDFIQLRNLNIDPQWYLKNLDFPPSGNSLGIRSWLDLLKKQFPWLGFGYFNPEVDRKW